jgi:glycerol uptake facilitator protein
MSPFLAELIGTGVLIIFGNGVVANVVLSRTKGNGAGWIVVTFGWGMAVFIGVLCSKAFSGAHLNPAVTIAAAAAGTLPWNEVPAYIGGQMIGAFLGAIVVYIFYHAYFAATEDADAKLACFCTSPNIRTIPGALFCEVVGTFMLVLPVFLMSEPKFASGGTIASTTIGLGTLGALPVGLVVFAIGMSLGGATGYAINPVRDFCPRLAHALLPIPGKRDSDWGYAWVPVVGPIIGGLLAACVKIGIHLT